MNETKIVCIDGVNLIFPVESVVPKHICLFKHACGAGNGIGEFLIPEKPVTVTISAA